MLIWAPTGGCLPVRQCEPGLTLRRAGRGQGGGGARGGGTRGCICVGGRHSSWAVAGGVRSVGGGAVGGPANLLVGGARLRGLIGGRLGGVDDSCGRG